ncbi:MAG TPA: GTPase, partial [Rugosimonospora sp.]|nr:GTPase [Rugosimonospora sp.]
MAAPPPAQQLRAITQLLATAKADRYASAVAAVVAEALDDLAGPVQVAVTGQIKRGKSTLINALTRQAVARTGVDEVTAAYHEFRFDRAPVPPPAPHSKRSRQPDRVVAAVPADLPARLRLIDTPGLSSPVTDTGGNAGLGADAALHLFENEVHHTDQRYLRGLLAGDGTAPLPTRVLGVITACDLSWPPARDRPEPGDPLAYHPLRDYAGPIIRRIVNDNPLNHDLFFAVQPVAALVGEGGWTVTGDQIDVLAELARRYDERALAGRLESLAGFVAADTVADPPARRQLVQLLGLWGVHVACRYLRDTAATAEGLRLHLDEESGVARVRTTLVDHFVGRSGAIKLERHLRRVERHLADARAAAQLDGVPVASDLAAVAAHVERLRGASLSIAELALVELVHRHDHLLTGAEASQLAALTGGGGAGCAPRLGLPADAGVDVMLHRAIALHRHWNRRTATLRELAPAVVRAYERLIARVG